MKSIPLPYLADTFSRQPKSSTLGLYVHIPFCQRRCHFCAFYLHVHREHDVERFLTNLRRELEMYACGLELGSYPVETIYFGGGTPTSLRSEQICRVLDDLTEKFCVNSDSEISIEAHPETVTHEKLARLYYAGFNRISFGIQSFIDTELNDLGGELQAHRSFLALEAAHEAGFSNMNIDLMYGLSKQTLQSWTTTLETTIKAKPTHVSCYALMIEDGTKFAADHRSGLLKESTSDVQVAMDTLAYARLSKEGFHRYEISNFAAPDFACRHNLRYWQGQAYLGFGPSAQSYVHDTRFGNESSLAWYCSQLEQYHLPILDIDPLSPGQAEREKMIFGLRLIQGIPVSHLSLPRSPQTQWEDNISALVANSLLVYRNGRLALTDKGRLVADSVADFLFHSPSVS